MFIELDLQADVPIYTQLVNGILEGIAKGELKPGDELPSVRMLAADLGINMHTVNKAYQLLKQEGFIQTHRKRGAVVNTEGFPGADEAYLQRLAAMLKPLVAESICRKLDEERFLEVCRALYAQFRGQGGE